MLPLEPDRFDAEDLAIGRILKRCRELGLTPEEASFYPRLAREIVDHEMAMRDRLVKGLSLEDNATLTLELTRGARALRPYIIDRMFQLSGDVPGEPSMAKRKMTRSPIPGPEMVAACPSQQKEENRYVRILSSARRRQEMVSERRKTIPRNCWITWSAAAFWRNFCRSTARCRAPRSRPGSKRP